MKTANRCTQLLTLLVTLAVISSSSGSALAQDDGARAYWNARAGTYVVSFQYLPVNIGASGSLAFAPAQYIYPEADIEANVFLATWAYHMTLLNRPAALAVNVVGGSVGADFNVDASTGPAGPQEFLPADASPGTTVHQSSSGFSDPNVQLAVNLFGTPPLRSGVDLLNYEPTWSLDVAAMLAFPIGEYEGDRLVNIGLNRWYGRLAFPFKYHFGVFDPGRMSSFEFIPSVWLFAENDDFMGAKLANDPLWSLEAHLTHDFTRRFFGSLDLLYQTGFQSKMDGHEVGEEFELGSLGFSLNYQVTDNVTVRTGYSSNLFGDENLETSFLRLQFVYAWHPATENAKKLQRGH